MSKTLFSGCINFDWLIVELYRFMALPLRCGTLTWSFLSIAIMRKMSWLLFFSFFLSFLLFFWLTGLLCINSRMGLDQFQGTQKERLFVVHSTFNHNNLNLALFIQFMLVIYNYPTTCNIHNARNTHLVLLCKIGRRFSAPIIPNHCFPIQRKAERKNHGNEMVATHWANTEKRSGNICIRNEMFVAIKMANLIIIFIECDQKYFCVRSLGVKTY